MDPLTPEFRIDRTSGASPSSPNPNPEVCAALIAGTPTTPELVLTARNGLTFCLLTNRPTRPPRTCPSGWPSWRSGTSRWTAPSRSRSARTGSRLDDASQPTSPQAQLTLARRAPRRTRSGRPRTPRPLTAGTGTGRPRRPWSRPVSTRNVRRPASSPPSTSVSIRSPTIALVSECAEILLSPSRIISGFGLPTKYGSTPVALVIRAATEPARRQGALQ